MPTVSNSKLTRADLLSLEEYAAQRPALRAQVMAHKRPRTIAVGPNMTWIFEDRITVRYQIQEMLRAERIFEPEGIMDELEAYNPLIPDGRNWKVTLLIEYPDPEVRRAQLAKLKGVEDRCWVQIAGHPRLYAIADEDLERENEAKTSSVHFLRFELTEPMVASLRGGAGIAIGVDHPHYCHEVPVLPAESRASLLRDLA
ncbi:MAG: DUF3501 family protein [Steroidobacteraceae bacterium]|nr:DUF3501 family protein [Steroidobacteraceae bacterium]MDW8260452.1 DUF3501 family protein [Gammaproteobacteria bacterium]